MRDRALKFLAWYDSLTAQQKRLFIDTVRKQLGDKGVYSHQSAHSAVIAARKYVQDFTEVPDNS